uniref:Uncharacterized protein n=1 Tax=Rhizophora mucronata TaxID=61149 RepID=A0A2P2PSY4_RHIMU
MNLIQSILSAFLADRHLHLTIFCTM